MEVYVMKKKTINILSTIALTAIGFIIIPPLLNKVSTVIYKEAMKKEKIDIDGLQPEIIKKRHIKEDL